MTTPPISLYLILDPSRCLKHHPIEVLEQAIEGGITCVQYRNKRLSTKDIAIAKDIAKRCRMNNIPFLVNDFPDLATTTDADGCHLGEEDSSPQSARQIIGKDKIIGLTLRRGRDPLSLLDHINNNNCDYIGIGPVFPSSSKNHKESSFLGVDGLFSFLNLCRKVTKEIPICAISGITVDNAEAVLKTGADGIAMISSICSATDPLTSVKSLQKIFLSTTNLKVELP